HDAGSVKVGNSQLDQVKNWMAANRPNRRIDALFVNIGANDADFANDVKYCLRPFVHCDQDSSFTSGVAQKIAALDGRYNQLATALQTLDSPSAKVYLSEYFDPVHKAPWIVCANEPAGDWLEQIDAGEAQWAYNGLIAPL